MDKLELLKEFFEEPTKSFYIRELARKLRKNHMTIRKYLNKYLEQGYLKKEKQDLYETYKSNVNKKYLNLKLHYNLEKIRKSDLVKDLNNLYDYPQIILFGSFANATDTNNSNIDVCIITNIKKM